eukprot:TRINITY_DN10513_c0_g1_i1.p1 TRINITY_DN10513_c0_g1~~TRINITY_DN10513_c0_g1_i1.p1  ORF type:complete len:308 (+),score=93.48 TRINITY_DN10513_c0_g1_i1:644-1567(+)
MFETIVTLVGYAVLAKFALDVTLGIYAKFLRPGKKLTKFGKWAIVTGATDGIGKAYAFEVAKKGMNVLIISRTLSKLEDTKKAILEKYPTVDVMCVAADMGNITSDVRENIKRAVSACGDVGLLVNNVGVSYNYPMYYHELSDEAVQSLVDLNVHSTNYMTRLVLPGMLERKRGAVVNMSSAAGEFCNPLLSGYNGAKSGVTNQTVSLNAEYASKGVHFQAQTPLFISTKLAKQRASFTVPTPETFVKHSVKAIGYEPKTSPYWPHAVAQYIVKSLPEFIANKQIIGMHLGLRKRGQKKDAEKAAQK